MKIALCTRGEGLSSPMDDRFGRADCFVLVDSESAESETINNPSLSASGGAGVNSAEVLSRRGVEVVIANNVGPKARRALQAAGIRLFKAEFSTAEENLEAFRKDELHEMSAPSVDAHSGSGRRRRFR